MLGARQFSWPLFVSRRARESCRDGHFFSSEFSQEQVQLPWVWFEFT